MPDLGKMFDENRDKVEQAAEKGVDAVEQRTGHKAPDAVDDRIDQIDPTDGDGGPGDAERADRGTDERRTSPDRPD